AAHVVAEKGLVALAGPFDRPANLARTPRDERELGEKAVFRTKIAADFVSDDTDRFKWHAEDRGKLLFLAHDAAGSGVKGIATTRSIIAADGGTRLHRHAGDAVDPGIEARHMSGPRKRLRRRFGVADFGIDHEVRQVIVETRGTGLDCGQRVRHRWQ